MKKIVLITSLCILFSNCKKDDITESSSIKTSENETKEELLLTIETPDDFFYETEQIAKKNGYIFLTNEKGELIAQKKITNNSYIEFKEKIDLNNEKYNISYLEEIVQKNFIDNKDMTYYILKTFLDVKPFVLSLKKRKHPYSSKLTVTNLPNKFVKIVSQNSRRRISSDSSTVVNFSFKNNPEDIYVYTENPEDNSKKYLLLEKVSDQSQKTYDYNNFTTIIDSLKTEYPENTGVTSIIYGAQNSNNHKFTLSMFYAYSKDNITHLYHKFPKGLFNSFKINTTLKLQNKHQYYHTTEITNKIPKLYIKPDLEFEIIENSYKNFELKSSSIFNYYEGGFYHDNIEKGNYDFTWRIYGKKSQTMNFSLSKELFEAIKKTVNFTTSLEDFGEGGGSLYKIDDIDYKNFIKMKLQPSYETNYSKYERLSKY